MNRVVRFVLMFVLLIIVGFGLLGFWAGGSWPWRDGQPGAAVGTTGTIDLDKARERGAEIGAKAALATAKVREVMDDAALTAKIKAKMALDDLVNARTIDVTTNEGAVRLSGTVRSAAERDRAIGLARETDGVTRVVDDLRMEH